MNIFKKVLGAAAILAVSAQVQAAPFVIDHFSETQNLAVNGGDAAMTNTVAGSMLGGFRTITLDASFEPVSMINGASVNTGAGTTNNESLQVNNDNGIAAIVTVLWDANGAGLGGEDLTDGGTNLGMSIDVLGIDTSTVVTFTLTDTLLGTHSEAKMFGTPGVFFVPFADFVGAGVDVTSIDSIKMVLTGADEWDADFDLVLSGKTIPTPAPLMLIGLSLVALGAARYRAKA